MIKLELK